MKFIGKTMAMVSMCVSSLSFAALSPQTENQTVSAIEFDGRFSPAQVQVYVNETIPNPNGCAGSSRYAFSNDDTGKMLVSALLTAKASGSAVQFNTDGCQDGVPKIVILKLN